MHMRQDTSMLLQRSTLLAALLAAGAGVVATPATASADGDGCHRRLKAPVAALLEPDINGHARLCLGREGVSGRMEVGHLQPGHAYTVWFVYLDDPTKCVGGGPGVCGDADFAGAKPLGVFGRYDSAVAPRRGEEDFEGRVRGFRPRRGSQVWLLMFGHGPADTSDRSHLARQLLTPEDPAVGAPHLGNTVDGFLGTPAAIAVFTIP
jgi:hypothetical protein